MLVVYVRHGNHVPPKSKISKHQFDIIINPSNHYCLLFLSHHLIHRRSLHKKWSRPVFLEVMPSLCLNNLIIVLAYSYNHRFVVVILVVHNQILWVFYIYPELYVSAVFRQNDYLMIVLTATWNNSCDFDICQC